ncbi:MAG: RNA polymerase sigma factor [Gemmatimonadota bacterium]
MKRIELEAELERLHAAAFGWALSCCAWDREAAEDTLQSSYLKVLDGRARFGGRSSFKTWWFGVIRRTAAEERRKTAWWRLLSLERFLGHPQLHDARRDPEAELIRSEASARLVAALGRLSARQRDLLHLVFYQELSIAEAADVLELPVGTARTHYERGKKRLRALLGGTDRGG